MARRWVFAFALVMVAAFSVFGIAVAHAADGDDETAVTFYPSDGFVRMDGVSLSNTRVVVQRGECVPLADFPDMGGALTYSPGRSYWGSSSVHLTFEGWNDGGMLPAILEPGETAIGNTVDETTPIDPPSYMSSARARAVYTYTDAVVLTVTTYGRGAGGGASNYTYHFDKGYSIADDNPENFIRCFVSWGTDGWSGVYLDSEFTELFDISTPLTTDTHLYFGPAPTVTRTVTFHGTTGGDADVSVVDGEALDAGSVPEAAPVDNATFAGWSASEVWPYRPGASDWEGDTFDLSAPITGDAELWPVYGADGFTVHVGYYDGDNDVSDFAERFVPRGYVIADDADLMAAAELDGGNLVGWFDNWYELSDDDRLTEEAPGRYAPTHRVDVTEPVTSSGYYVAVYGSLKARDLPVVPPEPDTVAVEFKASDGELLRDGGAYTVDDGTSSAEVERGGRIPADAFPDMSGAFSYPQPDDNGLSPVTLSFDGWRDGGAVQVAVDAPTGNPVDGATEIDPDGDTLALGASYSYADAVTLTVTVDDGTGNPSVRSYKVDRGGGIADAGKFARFFDPSGELGAYDGADASTAGTVDLATVAFGDDAHLYFLSVPAPVVTRTVTFHGTTGGDVDVSVTDGEVLDAADIPDAATVDNAAFAGWTGAGELPHRASASDWSGYLFETAAPIIGDIELWPAYYVVAAPGGGNGQPGDGGGNDDDQGGGSDDGNDDGGDDQDGDGGTGNQGGTGDGDGSDDGGTTGEDGNDGGSSDDAIGDGEDDGKADAGGDGTGTLDSQDGGKAETSTGTIPDGVYGDVKEAIDATGAAFPPMAKPAAPVTRLPQTGDGLDAAVLLLLVGAALCCFLIVAFVLRHGKEVS